MCRQRRREKENKLLIEKKSSNRERRNDSFKKKNHQKERESMELRLDSTPSATEVDRDFFLRIKDSYLTRFSLV